MKKTSKSILSLLLVFLFVFQFAGSAGIAAFADDDTDKAEETETFSVAIKVDGEDYTAPVSRAKLKGGVEFTPATALTSSPFPLTASALPASALQRAASSPSTAMP